MRAYLAVSGVVHLLFLTRADGQQVQSGFLRAIHPQQLVHETVEEGAHGAGAQPGRLGRQVDVLGDMASLEQSIAIGSFAIAPAQALEDSRQDKDHADLSQERLPEPGARDLLGKFGLGQKDKEGRRPLILWVALPTGTFDQYAPREAVEALLGIGFGLIRQHFASLEATISKGCDSSGPKPSDRLGRGLLGQLRAFRERSQQGG